MTAQSKAKYGLMVVSAPSGAGKSTLCTQLLKELSKRLTLSISWTTRPPRGNEKHGKEYFFVDRNKFEEEILHGKGFAEKAEVHGNLYGTSKQALEDSWESHKHVLLDIDVQGAETLRDQYPDRIFTVFIAPPDLTELERRLRGRGTDTEEAIQKRMRNAIDEMARKDEFDWVLVNDDYLKAYNSLKEKTEDFMNRLEAGKWQKRP